MFLGLFLGSLPTLFVAIPKVVIRCFYVFSWLLLVYKEATDFCAFALL